MNDWDHFAGLPQAHQGFAGVPASQQPSDALSTPAPQGEICMGHCGACDEKHRDWESVLRAVREERDTWKWAVGVKDKQILEFADEINKRGETIHAERESRKQAEAYLKHAQHAINCKQLINAELMVHHAMEALKSIPQEPAERERGPDTHCDSCDIGPGGHQFDCPEAQQ